MDRYANGFQNKRAMGDTFLEVEFNVYPRGTYWGCKNQQIQAGFWLTTKGRVTSDGIAGKTYEIITWGWMFLYSN